MRPVSVYTNLISASSLTPPKDILWNFLCNAAEIDLARVVFPTPGFKVRLVQDLFSNNDPYRTNKTNNRRLCVTLDLENR